MPVVHTKSLSIAVHEGEEEPKHNHMLNVDLKLAPKQQRDQNQEKYVDLHTVGQIVINAIHRSANILFLDKMKS